MNTKNISIGALVAVVLVLGVLVVKQPTVVQVPTSLKFDASTLGGQKAPVVNVEAAKPVVVPAPVVNVNVPQQSGQVVPQQVLGSVTGPDLYSPYFNVNNVVTWFGQTKMYTATTTLCAIKSPGATTTLASASWQITTGTSTAATIDLATSTTAFSTTTNLVSATSVASGAQGNAVWYPAGGSVSTDTILAPNTYIVVKTAGAGLSGYTYTGTCKAIMRQL